MARIEKELVLGGKGYVFINDIPFAYATGFELKGDWETKTLARSHALVPDRIFYTSSKWSLTIPVKQLLLKSHLMTFYTAMYRPGTDILKAVDVDGITDSSGDITFTDIVPTGYTVANIDSVPLVVSTDTSKFDLYVESGTVSGSDIVFTGLPANAKIKAYLVFKKSGEAIEFDINTTPKPVSVQGYFIDPFDGQVGIEVFRAIPKNFGFKGLGEDFQEQTLEFDVVGDDNGKVFRVWHIE